MVAARCAGRHSRIDRPEVWCRRLPSAGCSSGAGSWPEARRIGDVLRAETVGGLLLVGAAVMALVWANSPWREAYAALGG